MKIDVKHIANLANLQVTDEESHTYEKQLSEVLEYIAKLDEVEVTGIEPTSQVTGLENVYRADGSGTSLSQKQAVSGARAEHKGLFVVKGIFEDE